MLQRESECRQKEEWSNDLKVLLFLSREKRGPTMDEVIESEWDSGLVGHLK